MILGLLYVGFVVENVNHSRRLLWDLLGMPSQSTAITTQEYIHSLANRLHDATGVKVLILDEGEVIDWESSQT